MKTRTILKVEIHSYDADNLMWTTKASQTWDVEPTEWLQDFDTGGVEDWIARYIGVENSYGEAIYCASNESSQKHGCYFIDAAPLVIEWSIYQQIGEATT